MKKIWTAVICAGVTLSGAQAQAPARTDIAFVGVTVLPMTGRDRLMDQTVVISGDRIASIGPRSSVRVPAGARIVDGRGKVLMPGLVDMHVHLAPTPGETGDPAQRALAVMLAYGVTTVRGMAGSPANLVVRQKIEAGTIPGPRFYAASPALNDANTKSPEDGKAAVDAAKSAGFDLIKSHELTDVATWQVIEDEAHKLGLPTAGHVSKPIGLPRALAAGEEVEHLDGSIPELLAPGSPERAADFGQVPPPEVILAAAKASDAQLDALAARVAAAHSWQVPTLSLFEKISDVTTPTERYASDPAMRYVPDPVLAQWAQQREQMGQGMTPEAAAAFTQLRRRIVAAYRKAGVRLMTGSDTAQAFHLWGPAEYAEIRSLAGAGLTPMEALRAATVAPRDYFRSLANGGSALGWKAEFGTIEPGARADVILLDADPSADLAKLDRPTVVVAGGRFYDRPTLDRLLEDASAAAKASGKAAAPQPTGPVRQAYIMRHLPVAGGSDPALSAAGASEARALADQLADAGIKAVFATPTRRVRETAEPLAQRLGVPVSLYDPANAASLAKAVQTVAGSVLIIGHSNTVPGLIQSVGGGTIAPLGQGDFGAIYRVDAGSPQIHHFTAGGAKPVQLGACTVKGLPADARCGTVEVPEDRALKSGRRIGIRIAVIPALKAATDDPLVVIPGGPGLGGVQDGAGIADLLGSMRQTRDLLLIDQRGTGDSNRLSCPSPSNAADVFAALSESSPEDVDQCRRLLEKKADLKLYHTREAVRDMDAVRAALGYRRLDLFGMSYGSRVALDYLRLYPRRVGQTVIRAAAPIEMKLPLYEARDTQRSYDRVAQACQDQPDCAARHPDLRKDLDLIVARLNRGPADIRIKNPQTGATVEGKLSREAFDTVLFSMLYIPEFYVQLPPLIERAREGDFSPIAQAASPFIFGIGDAVAWGMHASVVCTEDVPFIKPSEVAAATRETFMGRSSVDHELAACRQWPRGRLPADYLRPVSSDKEVLIISGWFDPIAGNRWGELVAKTLPNSVHVEVPGASHLPPLPGCTDRLVGQFLDGTTVRQLDTRCVAATPTPKLRA